MGYTHYWRIDLNVVTAGQFKRLGIDARRLFDVAAEQGVPVAYESDDERPAAIGEGVIRFNGVGDDGYETFYFDATPNTPPPDDSSNYDTWQYESTRDAGNRRFGFCKTARQPYDAVVTAFLIRAKVILGEGVRVTSDGDYTRDWADGARLYRRAYDERARSPIAPPEPDED